jgi:predicted Zn-dependent protease
MRRWFGPLVALVCLLALPAAAGPRKRDRSTESPSEVAGLLVREGEWDRARDVLAGIDVAAPDVDVARVWTLRGLVAIHDNQGAAAVAAFEAALAVATEGRELLQLHLARALLLAGEPARARVALDAAGELGASLPGTWLLRAQAEEQSGNPDGALDALQAGEARFPDRSEFPRQSVFLLVRLGLFREARESGEALLARPDAGTNDAVAIAEALRRGGETSEALTILEAALLREPDDRDLLVQAARASLDAGQPRAAGRFLERASVLDPALSLEAAEAYRRAGDFDAALRVNAAVADPAAKARQRLGLHLDAEQWDRALALEERLLRLGLTGDDNIAYGLAFASYQAGDRTSAERWLKGIVDPEIFRRAGELRAAMAECVDVGCP